MLQRWLPSFFSSKNTLDFTNYIAVIIGACNAVGEAIAMKCVSDEQINIVIVDLTQNRKALSSLQNRLRLQSPFKNINIESFIMQSLSDIHEINHLILNIKLLFNTDSIQFLFNTMDSLIGCKSNHQLPTILTSDSLNNNRKLQQMMDLNFWSILHLTQCFFPLLISKENIESNKQCFIVNTSSLNAFSHSDSMYSVTKYCINALSEKLKYDIDHLLETKKLQIINHRNPKIFDVKIKILCPGFVVNNDNYNLVNISHKYDELDSIERIKKIIKEIQISKSQFGSIIFDGIRNHNVFIIQSHPKISKVYAADKMLSMTHPNSTRHLLVKRFLKSIISKL